MKKQYRRTIAYLLFLQLLSISILHARTPAISPLPYPPSPQSNKSIVGEALFKNPVFSKDNSLSCNSCHSLEKAGIDGLPVYMGLNKTKGTLNTPTVYNSKLNFRQFWDGRAKNFSDVIDIHIKDETIFSNNWDNIIASLKKDPVYVNHFKKAYTDEKINVENVKDALIIFLNNLMTPESPFDRYLGGEITALSDDAKMGYELFRKYGCISCHQGPNMGGNLFEKLGIYKDYPFNRPIVPSDLGLYNITQKESDKFVFKVPSLRNIDLTGPYLHDGSIATLEKCVEIMGIYQVGQSIPQFQIDYIVKFLKSLSALEKEKEKEK